MSANDGKNKTDEGKVKNVCMCETWLVLSAMIFCSKDGIAFLTIFAALFVMLGSILECNFAIGSMSVRLMSVHLSVTRWY